MLAGAFIHLLNPGMTPSKNVMFPIEHGSDTYRNGVGKRSKEGDMGKC